MAATPDEPPVQTGMGGWPGGIGGSGTYEQEVVRLERRDNNRSEDRWVEEGESELVRDVARGFVDAEDDPGDTAEWQSSESTKLVTKFEVRITKALGHKLRSG